jgi:hypothetical protein
VVNAVVVISVGLKDVEMMVVAVVEVVAEVVRVVVATAVDVVAMPPWQN